MDVEAHNCTRSGGEHNKKNDNDDDDDDDDDDDSDHDVMRR